MPAKYQYCDLKIQAGNEKSSLKKSKDAKKKDWNKLWHRTQCTSTSLLHFDTQFRNSWGDPTENKHLK